MRLFRFISLITAGALALQARVVETVVPALVYDRACVTRVELRNLAARVVTAEVEGHRGTGSLVPFVDESGTELIMQPGARRILTLDIPETTDSAWLRVREAVPDPAMSPALAVTAKTECVSGNQLLSSVREAAFPLRNPWFAGDVGEMEDDVLAVVNVSERAAVVTGCYDSGTLISLPGRDLRPLCSSRFRDLLPPSSARRYPVRKDGNSRFSLNGSGDAIVLQMLHRLDAGVRLYSVNATISFGGEAPPQ